MTCWHIVIPYVSRWKDFRRWLLVGHVVCCVMILTRFSHWRLFDMALLLVGEVREKEKGEAGEWVDAARSALFTFRIDCLFFPF